MRMLTGQASGNVLLKKKTFRKRLRLRQWHEGLIPDDWPEKIKMIRTVRFQQKKKKETQIYYKTIKKRLYSKTLSPGCFTLLVFSFNSSILASTGSDNLTAWECAKPGMGAKLWSIISNDTWDLHTPWHCKLDIGKLLHESESLR